MQVQNPPLVGGPGQSQPGPTTPMGAASGPPAIPPDVLAALGAGPGLFKP